MSRKEVMDFYNKLDRAYFMTNEYKNRAKEDSPFPIGFGQTISQPSLVVQMTIWLELEKSHKVLEIGTGSGYQTALLAEFAGQVYTIELIKQLSEEAQVRLNKLGATNIHYKIGDGSEGWKEHAPYERIITTAAAGRMPDKLLEQLSPGGIAIMPIGPPLEQELWKISKNMEGTIEATVLGGVRFVELKGQYGW